MTQYKMTYEIIVDSEDDVSMNNADDAVSQALFALGSDGELIQTMYVSMLTIEEV